MEQLRDIKLNMLEQELIYPVFEQEAINQELLDTLGQELNDVVNREFKKITTIHTLGKYPFKTITFIGLGSKDALTTKRIREASSQIKLENTSAIYLNNFNHESLDIHLVAKLIIESYLISVYKERKIGHSATKIHDLNIIYDHDDLKKDIEIGLAYGQGINYARMISDTPSNLMTPATLVEHAQQLAKEYGLKCTILNHDDLEKMKAGGILSVNLGSNIPAYMICLDYHNSDEPYTAIIGKGLTFDSGGYDIKSNSFGMKYDMCGGGDVLGIMKIIGATKPKANIYGIIPTTENLINDKAYKPQDVITTLSKKTVEIVSTDAEGRLILCDAITYAQQLKATKIIDLATLTGACCAALGDVYTGVFSNDEEYYQEFADSLKRSDEKGWRLPIDPEYFDKLKSTSADFKNCMGKSGGGASVAANFLEAFIENGTKWIHLDIAGTADNDGTAATGAMIRSVVNMFNK